MGASLSQVTPLRAAVPRMMDSSIIRLNQVAALEERQSPSLYGRIQAWSFSHTPSRGEMGGDDATTAWDEPTACGNDDPIQ